MGSHRHLYWIFINSQPLSTYTGFGFFSFSLYTATPHERSYGLMNTSACVVVMMLLDSWYCFMRSNTYLSTLPWIEESPCLWTSALLEPPGTKLLLQFQPCGHFFSLLPQHRKTILPESLLSPSQWPSEGDGVFFCGSHTVSSIPKIDLFEPCGVWLFVKVLLALFTAFSRIQMSQKIEARNTFMWETV